MKSTSLPVLLPVILLSAVSIAALVGACRSRHPAARPRHSEMQGNKAEHPAPSAHTPPRHSAPHEDMRVAEACTRRGRSTDTANTNGNPAKRPSGHVHPPANTVGKLLRQLRLRNVHASTIAAALAYVRRYWLHAGHLPENTSVTVTSGHARPNGDAPYIALELHHDQRDRYVYLVREARHGLLLADGRGRMLHPIRWRVPVAYTRISSGWGWRTQPVLGGREFHKGIDYAAPMGTPVRATMAGIVDLVHWHGNYGKLIEIRHADGLATRYGHLSRFAAGITDGTRVHRGQVVGYVGTTGLSTGPHLYFELWRHGRRINPLRAVLVRIAPRTSRHEHLLAWAHKPSGRTPVRLAAP